MAKYLCPDCETPVFAARLVWIHYKTFFVDAQVTYPASGTEVSEEDACFVCPSCFLDGLYLDDLIVQA